jgi:hypothetical protein
MSGNNFLNQVKAENASLRKELSEMRTVLSTQLGVQFGAPSQVSLLGELDKLSSALKAVIAAGRAFAAARVTLFSLVRREELQGLFHQLVSRLEASDQQLLAEDSTLATREIQRREVNRLLDSEESVKTTLSGVSVSTQTEPKLVKTLNQLEKDVSRTAKDLQVAKEVITSQVPAASSTANRPKKAQKEVTKTIVKVKPIEKQTKSGEKV